VCGGREFTVHGTCGPETSNNSSNAVGGGPPLAEMQVTLLSWTSTHRVTSADARCDVDSQTSRVHGALVALEASALLATLVGRLK
jgi:hypothetical protein